MPRKRAGLVLFLVICLSVGWLGSLTTRTSIDDWYRALSKPPLNPPDWIFAPVWTFLYILMAVAGWRIWYADAAGRKGGKTLFAAQLFLNGLWSYLFFGLRNPPAAFLDIGLLWFCILLLVRREWPRDRTAALLLTPYLAWVSFAGYLNLSLWWLNR